MALYIELWALLAALFILYLLIRFLKNPLHIIVNSILGILLLLIVNTIFNLGIPINIFSVGIVALGGLTGFLLILLLHFIGLGF
ncbi:MAG: pro-sigmaK processing inhibitor BofA family protein [Candidatus Bilamarchaeum sp.]